MSIKPPISGFNREHQADRRDMFPAALLSVAVHGALFVGLFTAFQWNTSEEAVYAELWAPEEISGGNDPSGVAEKLPEVKSKDTEEQQEQKAAAPEPNPPAEPPPTAQPEPAQPTPEDIAREKAQEAQRIEEEQIARAAQEELEARRQEAERIAQERARAEEIERMRQEAIEAEQRRLAEEARREEEERIAQERLAEQAKRAEEERQAEEARRQEAARLAEEARKAEEAKKAEEERRAAEAEAKRIAEELKREEAERQAQEAAQKAAAERQEKPNKPNAALLSKRVNANSLVLQPRLTRMRSARAPLEVISATSAEASPAPHWPPGPTECVPASARTSCSTFRSIRLADVMSRNIKCACSPTANKSARPNSKRALGSPLTIPMSCVPFACVIRSRSPLAAKLFQAC